MASTLDTAPVDWPTQALRSGSTNHFDSLGCMTVPVPRYLFDSNVFLVEDAY